MTDIQSATAEIRRGKSNTHFALCKDCIIQERSVTVRDTPHHKNVLEDAMAAYGAANDFLLFSTIN